jgi:hypothetical protein
VSSYPAAHGWHVGGKQRILFLAVKVRVFVDQREILVVELGALDVRSGIVTVERVLVNATRTPSVRKGALVSERHNAILRPTRFGFANPT